MFFSSISSAFILPLFSTISLSFPPGRQFKKAVFFQVMWSTFVCSNLTKECLAFTRLCLHGAAKEGKKKGGEGRRERESELREINS